MIGGDTCQRNCRSASLAGSPRLGLPRLSVSEAGCDWLVIYVEPIYSGQRIGDADVSVQRGHARRWALVAYHPGDGDGYAVYRRLSAVSASC